MIPKSGRRCSDQIALHNRISDAAAATRLSPSPTASPKNPRLLHLGDNANSDSAPVKPA